MLAGITIGAMHRPLPRHAAATALWLWLAGTNPAAVLMQQAPPPAIHVVTISSGPSGSEINGNFVLSSERSIFNRASDREVLALFQWDGAAGPHRLVAQWRSPDSAVTSNSAIDYVARTPRFGAYWSLPLSPSMALGSWSIEATVDGVPAGRLTFEVTDAPTASSPARRVLTAAELYERLNSAFIMLRRSSKAGRELSAAAGFSPARGVIYTTMSALDNVDDIGVVSRTGAATPVPTAVAWNRRQQWAVLSGTSDTEPLPSAAAAATHVGSRCASLEVSDARAPVLSECTITGQSAPGAPAALIATFFDGRGTPGAPVLNEFGDVIGLVGDRSRTGEILSPFRLGGTLPGTPIVPIGLITVDASAAPVPLSDLRARGVTVPIVVGDENVTTAGFGRVTAKAKLERPEHHDDLPLREKGFAVFVTWAPKERLRGRLLVRLFDTDNVVVAESKPEKIDFRKDQNATSSWSLPMVAGAGTYRADVFLDATVMWRGFVRITP